MCFYRPRNETNEWGPWPLRGAKGREVEKQLPELAQKPQHQCPVRSSGDLGTWGLGSSPSLGLYGFSRRGCGARGGPEQEEVSADLPCRSGAGWEESTQACLRNLQCGLLLRVLWVLRPGWAQRQ